MLAILLVGAVGCAEAPPDEGRETLRDRPPAAPGEDGEQVPGPEGWRVEMRNMAFIPQNLEVRAGETVTWVNSDGVPHTVTGDGGLDSARMAQGDSYRFTFEEPGQYRYRCSIHPTMEALVVVR